MQGSRAHAALSVAPVGCRAAQAAQGGCSDCLAGHYSAGLELEVCWQAQRAAQAAAERWADIYAARDCIQIWKPARRHTLLTSRSL